MLLAYFKMLMDCNDVEFYGLVKDYESRPDHYMIEFRIALDSIMALAED